jgi:hypothetical protein
MNSTENQIDQFSQNPVSGFPLTDGDLVALAETWWKVFIHCDLFCVLTATGLSGSDEYEMTFASDRLHSLQEKLGKDEIQRIRGRVEERWRRKIGEAHWNAYKAGHAIIREEAEERSEKQAERSGEGDIPRNFDSDVGSCSNAETAAIHRWITTEPDVRDWGQIVANHLEAPEPLPTRRDIRAALASDLRKWAAKEWYPFSSGLLSDLLDLAFFRANWLEIAESLLSAFERGTKPKNPHPEN